MGYYDIDQTSAALRNLSLLFVNIEQKKYTNKKIEQRYGATFSDRLGQNKNWENLAFSFSKF